MSELTDKLRERLKLQPERYVKPMEYLIGRNEEHKRLAPLHELLIDIVSLYEDGACDGQYGYDWTLALERLRTEVEK